jgi:metaxin
MCLQVYSEACEVLSALADKLRSSEGRYVFGTKPSSLDALLFGHLIFYRTSPAAAPVLKAKVCRKSAVAGSARLYAITWHTSSQGL